MEIFSGVPREELKKSATLRLAAKKPKLSPEAQRFISKHIGKHIKEDGMPRDQAIRVAYEEAKKKGYKVPPPPKGSAPRGKKGK